MVFAIQRFLEDYIERRRLHDPDQYAIRLANVYDRQREKPTEELLRSLSRIRTAFFRANPEIVRHQFEKEVLSTLKSRFGKKKEVVETFPGGLTAERRRLATSPRRIGHILKEFAGAVESRAIDVFWKSRKTGELRNRPEQVGQSLLVLFLRGAVPRNSRGLVFQEIASGIGYIDLIVILTSVPHVIELKILTNKISGVSQLIAYLEKEDRNEGWLVLFDARNPEKRVPIPDSIVENGKTIRTIVIDIRPIPPSRK